jgi:hypothetical protein
MTDSHDSYPGDSTEWGDQFERLDTESSPLWSALLRLQGRLREYNIDAPPVIDGKYQTRREKITLDYAEVDLQVIDHEQYGREMKMRGEFGPKATKGLWRLLFTTDLPDLFSDGFAVQYRTGYGARDGVYAVIAPDLSVETMPELYATPSWCPKMFARGSYAFADPPLNTTDRLYLQQSPELRKVLEKVGHETDKFIAITINAAENLLIQAIDPLQPFATTRESLEPYRMSV